jgi:hypothetical protein
MPKYVGIALFVLAAWFVYSRFIAPRMTGTVA